MDYYDGTPSQLDVFRAITGITYPLCRLASPTGRAYGVTNEWNVVVDQQGIIRYKNFGTNLAAITAVIDQHLANSGISENPAAERGFVLHQNYPNPFNPATHIAFELLKGAAVSLKVFSLRGELITTLLDQDLRTGRYEVAWNAKDEQAKPVASGIYFYELRTGAFSERRKMLLMQ